MIVDLLQYWANTPGHPNFCEIVCFRFVCRLSAAKLGHTNCLNPTVPRAAFKIQCSGKCLWAQFFCEFVPISEGLVWICVLSFWSCVGFGMDPCWILG